MWTRKGDVSVQQAAELILQHSSISLDYSESDGGEI
jgi:hypothetical protein